MDSGLTQSFGLLHQFETTLSRRAKRASDEASNRSPCRANGRDFRAQRLNKNAGLLNKAHMRS